MSEFKRLCDAADFDLTDAEVKKAVEMLDKRASGYVEFDEFAVPLPRLNNVYALRGIMCMPTGCPVMIRATLCCRLAFVAAVQAWWLERDGGGAAGSASSEASKPKSEPASVSA